MEICQNFFYVTMTVKPHSISEDLCVNNYPTASWSGELVNNDIFNMIPSFVIEQDYLLLFIPSDNA